jgi:Zn-dependent protease
MEAPMLENSLRLFRPFGIRVNVHWSWLILAVLISSSLATAWFPSLVPGLSAASYWTAGIVGAIGLFISILLHELCHAIVGRRYNLPINQITLFLFGGVAQMEEDPPTPKSEFQMAIAGPLASVGLSAFFTVGHELSGLWAEAPGIFRATLAYLASINFVVAVFNMLPGYPLDGGRVLRSALWYWKGDVVWATKIASGIGQAFGAGLIVLGAFSLFASGDLGGLWPVLLGLLLISFARTSYMQLLVRQSLHGKSASQFMNPAPRTFRPDTPVDAVMREFLNENDQNVLPVVADDNRLVGCVDLQAARSFPESEWRSHAVGEVTKAPPQEAAIGPETDAETALGRMAKNGVGELLVVDGQKLVGILNRSALLRYLSLRGV